MKGLLPTDAEYWGRVYPIIKEEEFRLAREKAA